MFLAVKNEEKAVTLPSSSYPSSGLLKKIDDFDSFRAVRDVPPEVISEKLIDVVRNLDEKDELEPYIRFILHDPNATPHGPAEIADIFTHKLSIQKLTGMAAFILKGRSFQTVKPKDVAHQIYRLEKIAGLAIAIFAAPGTTWTGRRSSSLQRLFGSAATILYSTQLTLLDCSSHMVSCALAMHDGLSLGAALAAIRPATDC